MELIGRLVSLREHPVLHLSGEIDLATLPVLHDHLRRAIDQHVRETLFVDLDGLISLDDTGLGMLLGAAGRSRELGGDLVIVCNNERLMGRFALTGLDRAITVVQQIAR